MSAEHKRSSRATLATKTGGQTPPASLLQDEDVQLRDDIDFWTRQLMEHAYFLYLGLVDDAENQADELKAQAAELYRSWNNLRDYDYSPEDRHRMGYLERLLADQAELETTILTELREGKWLGYLYPSYLEHTMDERTFLEQLISDNPPTTEERVAFWNDVNKDHAAVEAEMMDPKEQKVIGDLNSFRELYEQLRPGKDYGQFVMLSLTAAEDLDRLHQDAKRTKPKSVIHPMLLDHVIREGQRSITMLAWYAEQMVKEEGPRDRVISTYSGSIRVPPPPKSPRRR